jgi:hypothetical protein
LFLKSLPNQPTNISTTITTILSPSDDDEDSFESARGPEDVPLHVRPPTRAPASLGDPRALRATGSAAGARRVAPHPSGLGDGGGGGGEGLTDDELRQRVDSAAALSTTGVAAASGSGAASASRAASALDGLQLFRVEDDNATFATLPRYFQAQGEAEETGGGKLGAVMGVYLPCVQNILGVILFRRCCAAAAAFFFFVCFFFFFSFSRFFCIANAPFHFDF